MLKLTLLKLRLNPYRLLLAAGVAVFTLFVMSLGWLQVTRVAKKKVETTVAKVSKKLGVPIEIGRFTITPVGAHFEDLRIGAEANIVISRMTAEVGMNPFSNGFGELDSVTVYKVRVKSGLARVRESVTSLKDAGLIESDKSVTAQKSLEKAFAALPTKHLTLKSGAVQILDDDGTPYVTIRGAQLIVDKAKTKVLFRVENVKSRDGFQDSYLQGRFELNPDTDSYRLFVRRKAGMKSSRNAWAVSGLIKKDLGSADLALDFKTVPAVIADRTERFLGKNPRLGIKGTLSAVRENGAWTFETNLTSNATQLDMPLLSPKPVGPVRFNVQAKGSLKPDERLFTVDQADISLPLARTGRYGRSPVHFVARGAGRLPVDEGQSFAADGQIQLVSAPCQQILDSAPPGLLPSLAGFKLDGAATFALSLGFDGARPEESTVDMHDGAFGCKVLKAPFAYSAEHLSGPFSLEREVGKNDEPLKIAVNPISPNFAALASVSKMASQAFVTSEDASFFQHNGIDGAALQYAFKRNLTEKRVAVGGSTITMQTVKNLFLTQERTLSRKLQELFLAWHLDQVLSKDRILEIYMNIAELGPGIYGVQQASERYFGKRASDLSLLESAYLASLLPSPKTRYRYFCDGKLSPNFQTMVHGLLRRMVSLNRVAYDRYLQAMSASIQFNDMERQSARECSRQAAVPQGEEDPS